jgi:hypothetical protein
MYVSNGAERLGNLRRAATPPRNLSDAQHEALSLYDMLWGHLRWAFIQKIRTLSEDDLAFLKDTCVNTSDINCGWTEYATAELVYQCCEDVEAERRSRFTLPERA